MGRLTTWHEPINDVEKIKPVNVAPKRVLAVLHFKLQQLAGGVAGPRNRRKLALKLSILVILVEWHARSFFDRSFAQS